MLVDVWEHMAYSGKNYGGFMSYKRIVKSVTYTFPSELREALIKRQAEMVIEGKKVPMRILIPSLLAECLGVTLPEGWDKKPERVRVQEEQ